MRSSAPPLERCVVVIINLEKHLANARDFHSPEVVFAVGVIVGCEGVMTSEPSPDYHLRVSVKCCDASRENAFSTRTDLSG